MRPFFLESTAEAQENGNKQYCQSPLPYPGGKSWLSPLVRSIMPSHLGYVEPFLGGGGMALNLLPRSKGDRLLNDVRQDLVLFWRSLQSASMELLSEAILSLDFTDFETYEKNFHVCRDRSYAFQASDEKKSKKGGAVFVADLCYLAFSSFNSMFKLTPKGYQCCFSAKPRFLYEGNPLAKIAEGKIFSSRLLQRIANARRTLSGCAIENKDYADLAVSNNNFVYADPPYDQPDKLYAERIWQEEDHRRFAAECHRWVDSGARVAVSYVKTELVNELFGHWVSYTIPKVHRMRAWTYKGKKLPFKEEMVYLSWL